MDAGTLTMGSTTIRARASVVARGLAVALGVAVLIAGCSDDGDAGATPDTTTTVDPAAVTTTTALQPVGDPVNRYQLEIGDCFNRYDAINVFTRVACDAPHGMEVFAKATHPAPFGEAYPNDREMQKFALQACYGQFQAFAGGLYEVSRLDIGVITPTKDSFEDSKARYRTITCFVSDQGGEPLVGSMRGRAE
jgi:hypothetical protein